MTIGSTHRTLREAVVDEIRGMITRGDIKPGDRLVEDRLAEQLGVSRNPVREALQALAAEGFVEILPRRGAVVAQITPEQAEDLFDVRTALEPLAARLAARRADADGVDRLREVLEKARKATDLGELDLLAACNTEFHSLVVDLSGNDYLGLLVSPMARRVQWVFRTTAPTRAPHSWTEHEELMRAIASGDEEYAEAVARSHVAAARASYRDLSAAP